MNKNHTIDLECSCENCTKIDMLIGDPLLNNWEKNFIESLSRYGWLSDYTPRQILSLNKIWQKIHTLRKIPLPRMHHGKA